MSQYKAPDPGKGWRLLKVGEIKPPDTEYIMPYKDGDDWEPCPTIGSTLTAISQYAGMFYRTREGVEPVKKEPNWKRLCALMYKAKTIRDARGIYERGRK